MVFTCLFIVAACCWLIYTAVISPFLGAFILLLTFLLLCSEIIEFCFTRWEISNYRKKYHASWCGCLKYVSGLLPSLDRDGILLLNDQHELLIFDSARYFVLPLTAVEKIVITTGDTLYSTNDTEIGSVLGLSVMPNFSLLRSYISRHKRDHKSLFMILQIADVKVSQDLGNLLVFADSAGLGNFRKLLKNEEVQAITSIVGRRKLFFAK